MPGPTGDLDRVAPIIEACGAGRRFGSAVALEAVDLQVEPGVVLGVIGPSGCGKTTLIRMLTGILPRTSGELRVLGDEPTAGVDPILRERFWARFRELREAGRTLVVSTQYVGEAATCDLVAVMSAGRLVVVDTPDGLRRRAMGGDVVHVVPERGWLTEREMDALRSEPCVVRADRTDDRVRVVVSDAADVARLAALFERTGTAVASLEVVQPSFDEVFVALVLAATLAASIGLGLIVSLVSPTDAQAVRYTMIVLLASLFFSGCFLTLDQLNYPARALSWALPSTFGSRLLRDVMLRGSRPDVGVLGALGAYATSAFVLTLLGARRRLSGAR